MAYRLVDRDPSPAEVRRLTFVPFLPSGDCAVLPDGLPSGEVRPGEDWLLDTCLRVPLETAGFRRQRVGAFAADGDHWYLWADGDRYTGPRPHATVDLVVAPAEAIAARLDPSLARVVLDGAHAFRSQPDDAYYDGNLRLLEPAYLLGTTPESGSGFGGDAVSWRANRGMIVDGIDRSGTFLDLGCANGLLMESVHAWAAERGHHIEPHGVDLGPGLVSLARRRLPHWADRIHVGNAISWQGGPFTFVHTLLDLVPVARRADLVRHALTLTDHRLLVSHYAPAGGTDRSTAEHLRRVALHRSGPPRHHRLDRRQPVHGLTTRTPVDSTSLTLRVTSDQPRTNAVAASRPSTTGSARLALSRPHTSAISAVTGTMRSP
jgi:hypothetical protein